ncbi:beta-ribofuranosylaminobenzene 5'-phosphate synthase family protein [Thermogladius sp. 4427co]|uniref:beta-ribofuranosylaminobenzene 5'-phosphate synthase family protein n=1 Tax=Thermogladius sp. 4427co TaxID=3450718 RepID=UPI003F79F2F3
MSNTVEVSAPSRLHFGIVNPHRVVGYRFYGSAGLAISYPRVVVRVSESDGFYLPEVLEEGEKASLVRVLREKGVRGVKADISSIPPRHTGFGTTTQLMLAIAAGAMELYGLEYDVLDLAWRLGRGRISSIGVYAFRNGGFIADAGKRRDEGIAPLLVRLDFPADWRFVLVLPRGVGFSGLEEERALGVRKAYPEVKVYEAAYTLFYRLIPAIIEKNPLEFASSLTRLQEIVGGFFAEEQGGLYHPASQRIVEFLEEAGIEGYGQSSWGPLIYIFAENENRAEEIAELVKRSGDYRVCITGPDNKGAVIRRL